MTKRKKKHMPPSDPTIPTINQDTDHTAKPTKPGLRIMGRRLSYPVIRGKQLSHIHLAAFVVVFAAIGTSLVFFSQAAPSVVASVEAEQMTLPAGASVIPDSTASGANGGSAVVLTQVGTSLSKQVSLASPTESLTVTAKGTKCKGSWPSMTVSVGSVTVLGPTQIASSSWQSYSVTKSLTTGTPTLDIKYSSGRAGCNNKLYVDVTNFYGPTPVTTPAPTVNLSASPTSVTAGDSATLTWSSTNANSCTASGGWSGAKATSGTESTGALSTTSTYSLSCSGAGGSASGSVMVSNTVASNGIYWGARIGYTDTGDAPWVASAWDRFETSAGKEISYLQFGQPFGSLDTNALNIIRARGAMPHVESLTRLPDGTSFTVTQIAQGQADTYMNSFCSKAKSWGYPFVYRFLWEFNGPWQDTYYGYSASYAYSRPADYVAAWKRFHDICQQVGATNIIWHWNANWWAAGTSAVDPRPWWPGIDYVDMVGVDAYADGRTLNQVMATAYPVLTSLAAGKPMYLETGVYEAGAGGSHIPPSGWTKAQWITDMFTNLPNYPAFDVLQWFNDDEAGRPSTQIETSAEATAAFRAGIANTRYVPQAQSLAPLK